MTSTIFQQEQQLLQEGDSPGHKASTSSTVNSGGSDGGSRSGLPMVTQRVSPLELGGFSGAGKLVHDSLSSPAGSVKSMSDSTGLEQSNQAEQQVS